MKIRSSVRRFATASARISDFGFPASFGFRISDFGFHLSLSLLVLFAVALPIRASSLITLHTFSLATNDASQTLTATNSDGSDPNGGLVMSSRTLYGTALFGGPHGSGTVFSMTNDGTGFKVLYAFSLDNSLNSDGSNPNGLMVLANGKLYGTTQNGGTYDDGVVFSLSTNGSSQTVLYTFLDAFTNNLGIYTNGAGFSPSAGLALGGSRLYGTAYYGGLWGNGTLFALTTNTSPLFTNPHTFTALNPNTATNIYGANPAAEILVAGGTLYMIT